MFFGFRVREGLVLVLVGRGRGALLVFAAK